MRWFSFILILGWFTLGSVSSFAGCPPLPKEHQELQSQIDVINLVLEWINVAFGVALAVGIIIPLARFFLTSSQEAYNKHKTLEQRAASIYFTVIIVSYGVSRLLLSKHLESLNEAYRKLPDFCPGVMF